LFIFFRGRSLWLCLKHSKKASFNSALASICSARALARLVLFIDIIFTLSFPLIFLDGSFDIKREAEVIRDDFVAFRLEVDTKFFLNVSSLIVSVDFGVAVKMSIVNEERKQHSLGGTCWASMYSSRRHWFVLFPEMFDKHICVADEIFSIKLAEDVIKVHVYTDNIRQGEGFLALNNWSNSYTEICDLFLFCMTTIAQLCQVFTIATQLF
jgi:hypothetical protein